MGARGESCGRPVIDASACCAADRSTYGGASPCLPPAHCQATRAPSNVCEAAMDACRSAASPCDYVVKGGRSMTSIGFPHETAEYRSARERLLVQEIELRRAMEAVAAARRALPSGGLVPEDYVFDGLGSDGAPSKIKLSELFAPGQDSLVVYNFMFPRHPTDRRPGPTAGATARLEVADGPCPSCTALLDQLDGAAVHVAQRINFVVVA